MSAQSERIDDLERALRAVLLWFGSPGWDAKTAAEWRRLTGSDDATSRALCDHVRAVLRIPVQADG